MIRGADRGAAINIEPAVIPAQHVFYNRIINLVHGLEHFEDFQTESIFQIFGIGIGGGGW